MEEFLEKHFEQGDLITELKGVGTKVRSGDWWMLAMCLPSSGLFLHKILEDYADDNPPENWNVFIVRIPLLDRYNEMLSVLIIRRDLLSYEDLVACAEEFGVVFDQSESDVFKSFGAMCFCSLDADGMHRMFEQKLYEELFRLAGLDPCEHCTQGPDDFDGRGCFDPKEELPGLDEMVEAWFSEN